MADKKIWSVDKKETLTGEEKLPIDDGTNTDFTTDINDIKTFMGVEPMTDAEVDALFV